MPYRPLLFPEYPSCQLGAGSLTGQSPCRCLCSCVIERVGRTGVQDGEAFLCNRAFILFLHSAPLTVLAIHHADRSFTSSRSAGIKTLPSGQPSPAYDRLCRACFHSCRRCRTTTGQHGCQVTPCSPPPPPPPPTHTHTPPPPPPPPPRSWPWPWPSHQGLDLQFITLSPVRVHLSQPNPLHDECVFP